MNSLIFALQFWNKHRKYKIWYNSNHCINIPTSVKDPFPNNEFRPAEDFGYQYFKKWTHALTTEQDKKLLKKYFKVK